MGDGASGIIILFYLQLYMLEILQDKSLQKCEKGENKEKNNHYLWSLLENKFDLIGYNKEAKIFDFAQLSNKVLYILWPSLSEIIFFI